MLAAIFRIVALVRKELLAMLKDPRGRAVLFVPPVLQCLVFGYVVNFDLNQSLLCGLRSRSQRRVIGAARRVGRFGRVPPRRQSRTRQPT